jgi:hypothetical protein
MLAELFQTTVSNISMHIRDIYQEGELDPNSTIKRFLTVRQEENCQIWRLLDYYNLDMTILVDYRFVEDQARHRKQVFTEDSEQNLDVDNLHPHSIASRNSEVFHRQGVNCLTSTIFPVGNYNCL